MQKLAVAAVAMAALLVAAPSRAATMSIVALGDSDTEGVGASGGQSYPAQLEGLLRAQGQDVKVKNAGQASRTAAQALAQLDSLVPDGTAVAIVMLGINDAKQGTQPGVIQARLTEIGQRLKQRKINVVFCGHGAGFIPGYPPAGVNQASVAAAQGTMMLFADCWAVINSPSGLTPGYTAPGDQQHLNGAGYRVMAQNMLPQVLRALDFARKGQVGR